MLKKISIVLFLLFACQFLVSCICDCGDSYDIKKTYTGITVSALNTSGFNNTVVEDSVFRNSFGLEVIMDFTSEEIAKTAYFKASGFSSANALSCDCIGPDYIYEDDIDFIDIYRIIGEESALVTSAFSIQNYSGEWTSLYEFFQIRDEWHDGFQIQLTDFEAVPDTSKFLIEVIMTSGNKFSATTKEITFI